MIYPILIAQNQTSNLKPNKVTFGGTAYVVQKYVKPIEPKHVPMVEKLGEFFIGLKDIFKKQYKPLTTSSGALKVANTAYIRYSRPSDKALKFGQEVITRYGPEVRVKYFRSFHYSHTIGIPRKTTLKSPCPSNAIPIITIIAPVILLIQTIVLILKRLWKRLNNHDKLNQ